jgi:restriction endonuclease
MKKKHILELLEATRVELGDLSDLTQADTFTLFRRVEELEEKEEARKEVQMGVSRELNSLWENIRNLGNRLGEIERGEKVRDIAQNIATEAEADQEPEFKKGDKVMAKHGNGEVWHRRYFAYESNGVFCTFDHGQTEWSSDGIPTSVWRECRRPTQEELEV